MRPSLPRVNKKIVVAAQVGFAAVAVWYVGAAVAHQWSAVGQSARGVHARWGGLSASCLLVLLAYALLIQTWRMTLRVWSSTLPVGQATRIWFVSNLGRYIPGKIWQISAMGVMTHRQGVSPVAAAGSSVMINLTSIVSGCLVVFATGARVLDLATRSGRMAAAGLAVLAVAALVSVPTIVSWLAGRAGAFAGRPFALPARLTPRVIAIGLLGTGVAWVLYGMAFQVFSVSLLGDAARGSVADYIAAYTASYVVGYLTLIAPGGLGVREAMLVLTLRMLGATTEPNGWILALASRLWLTVLEVIPGLLFLLAGAVDRPRPIDAGS